MRWLILILLMMPWMVRAEAVPAAGGPTDHTTLVADSVALQSPTVLVAKGHVEVFFQNRHLTASAVIYDRAADRLTITGPIRVEDGSKVVVLADQADLSADLTEGLLTSARVVMNQRLQLAAAQVLRTDGGRYTAMRRVVASGCTICQGSTTPLWEIRAREVVHDALAQQIWFSDATLRFANVPVLYIPVLRVPDPTLSRATGLLIPKLRSTSLLGTGLKLPYFITLGPSRDLLITPYFTNRDDQTLDLRYRQAFAHGTLEVEGALTHDTITAADLRGYLEATGSFDLGHGFHLGLHALTASDSAYLSDYAISNADLLNSRVDVTKVQRNLYFSASALGLRWIRAGESNSTQPSFLTDMEFHRRFLPALLGGEGDFEIQTHSQYRPSTDPLDTNGDGITDGRDMARLTFKGDWRRNWTLNNGMEVSTEADLRADFYTIAQDAVFAGHPVRSTGTTGIELRWPWVKVSRSGASQLIEPVVQLVTAPRPSLAIPNEDSALVEFDESNLFALNRYPGADAFEGGTRLNFGVNYLRTAASGWTAGLTAGRVFWATNPNAFSATSGLRGKSSDWLVALSLAGVQGLSLTARALLDDTYGATKGEMRFNLNRPKLVLSGGYEYLRADTAENRSLPVREMVLNGTFDLTRYWKANVTTRYDLVAAKMAKAGLNLNFQNECLSVDISLSRQYTTSTSVRASTDFGLSLALLGFGGSSANVPGRVCRK